MIPASAASFHPWLGAAFQIFLLFALVGSVWQLIGFEPDLAFDYHIQLCAIGFAYFCCAALWLASTNRPAVFKMMAIAACVALIVGIAINAAREFEIRQQILRPGRLRNGRVVHDGLKLSYRPPANFLVNLRPMVTKLKPQDATPGPTPSVALGYGEMAIISRLVQERSTIKADHSPASIIVEVQRDTMADLNAFILDVRRKEENWATFPQIKITRKTHRSQIAGLNTVEFEFVESPRNLISWQVYLRTGAFVLNFMLNTENEADRPLFDEFLRSMKLGEDLESTN